MSLDDMLYRTATLRFGDVHFGPLEFVALPLVQPTGVDAYLGYNFFLNHIAPDTGASEMNRLGSTHRRLHLHLPQHSEV